MTLAALSPAATNAPGLMTGNLTADERKQDQAYASGLVALSPFWLPLPMGPYPPASDSTGFPRTGDASLVVSRTGLTIAQQAEPGLITQNLYLQAQARRPQLSPLFYVGVACLAGYFLLRK